MKTYYCDEGFEKVTAGCPVPIVMAGGKKLPELDALTMAYRAIDDGAAGVDMGRNIFQSDAPSAMLAGRARGRPRRARVRPRRSRSTSRSERDSVDAGRRGLTRWTAPSAVADSTLGRLLAGGPRLSVGMLTADLLAPGPGDGDPRRRPGSSSSTSTSWTASSVRRSRSVRRSCGHSGRRCSRTSI